MEVGGVDRPIWGRRGKEEKWKIMLLDQNSCEKVTFLYKQF